MLTAALKSISHKSTRSIMTSSFTGKLASLKNPSLIKSQSFINNEWVSSASGKTFKVHDPSTGEQIGPDVAECGSPAEVERAIKVAKEAFKTYRHTTPKARQDMLTKLYSLMLANADDMATIITAENGKPIADARGEHAYSASFCEWFAAEAMRTYGDVIPSTIPGLRNVVIKQPVGPVAIITPWNFPSAMITRKIAPALAAGCTCVIKVPAETPFSGLALGQLVMDAGFPAGVVNIITSEDSKTVGEVLCASKDIKKVSFTGSTNVGKILARQSAGTLKKLSLELGGNAPFIVFDDADVDAAVQGAIACKFRSSGQTCVCANRILVHEKVADEFSTKLVDAVNKFKVGDGIEQGM
jgi:succinate-semialdehyde dehydrogenase/glutarate-semialdehyde dehydrogenase